MGKGNSFKLYMVAKGEISTTKNTEKFIVEKAKTEEEKNSTSTHHQEQKNLEIPVLAFTCLCQ